MPGTSPLSQAKSRQKGSANIFAKRECRPSGSDRFGLRLASTLDRLGNFYEPTVLADVPVEADIAREEIFGPVVSIITFTDEDEAVNIANARHKSEHRGSIVYFCCARCKQAFDLQPEKYSLLISS